MCERQVIHLKVVLNRTEKRGVLVAWHYCIADIKKTERRAECERMKTGFTVVIEARVTSLHDTAYVVNRESLSSVQF